MKCHNYIADRFSRYQVQISSESPRVPNLTLLGFDRVGDEFRLAEIESPKKAQSYMTMKNVDEDAGQEMVEWYYTKERTY